MIKNKTFVITTLQDWDLPIGSNCKNMALEISRNNKVIYVNPPLDRLTLMKKRNESIVLKRLACIKTKSNRLQKIYPNLSVLTTGVLMESINQLTPHFLFSLINKMNNQRFANAISETLKKENISEFYLFTDSDMFRSFHLKELLHPKLFIYYTRDNLLAVKYWQRNGKKKEPKIMKKAELVVSNSEYLADLAKRYQKNSENIGQGCELEMYDREKKHRIPEEFKNIQGPVIGYAGALNALRLDIEILDTIAKVKPGWTIFLVGPEDETFRNSALHKRSNVVFTGIKKPEELPAYIQNFDVAINPQVLNEVTRGNYPRKIDEYLAMGKPVVATKTRAMDYFSKHVSLASTAQDYIEMLENALADGNKKLQEERVAFACSHTWKNSVSLLYNSINKTHKNVYK